MFRQTELNPQTKGTEASELEVNLRRLIVEKDEAIQQIVNVYQMYLAGLAAACRPVGNFLFLGPPGSGNPLVGFATASSIHRQTWKRRGRELFVAQGGIGIEAHGAARRDIGSEQGDESKKHSYACECDWVRRAHSEKETGQEARDRQGCANADRHSESREPCAFAYDQTQYVRSPGAERHANADFLGAASNREGHNSVDADRRKSQSSGRE